MPAWITDMGAASLIPVIAALAMLSYLAAKAYRPLAAFFRFMDQLIGRPDHPGLIDRMSGLEEKLATVHHEVSTNSGGSIKDAVARIEAYQRDQGGQIVTLTGRFDEHLDQAERRDSRLDDLTDRLERFTEPECD